MTGILRLVRVGLGALVLASATMAKVEIDTLELVYDPVNPFYTLSEDMHIGTLTMAGGRIALAGHTLEVDHLRLPLAGSPHFQGGTVVIKQACELPRLTLGSDVTLVVSPGAVLTLPAEQYGGDYWVGELFAGSAKLVNEGTIEVWGRVTLGLALEGSGRVVLHDEGHLRLVHPATFAAVEGEGNLYLGGDAHFTQSIVDPIGISFRELVLDPAVVELPNLLMGKNSVLRGEGVLQVNALEVSGGRIEGLLKVVVADRFVETKNPFYSFYSEAEIVTTASGGFALEGPGLLKEGDIWVANVGTMWEGTREGVEVPLSITASTTGSVVHYTIEPEWFLNIRGWNPDAVNLLMDGETRSELVVEVSSGDTEGAFSRRVVVRSVLDGYDEAILEVRGEMVRYPRIDIQGIGYYYFGPTLLGDAPIEEVFGFTVATFEETPAKMRVRVGGQYGRYHVPEQVFEVTGSEPTFVPISFRYDPADLPDSLYESGGAEIPIVFEHVPPAGRVLPSQPFTMIYHASHQVYGAGIPAEIPLEFAYGQLRFVELPGLHYRFEYSRDLVDWETSFEFVSEQPGFAAFWLTADDERLGGFFRVQARQSSDSAP